jgi:hypothetical protein
MGHTMSIHSRNDDVILEFGLKKPAFRIVVNSPTTHGSIGLSTGLDPSMTLGCGGYGGNITSDNISPRHLLNIKRLAYEIAPVTSARPAEKGENASKSALPQAPAAAVPGPGIAAGQLGRRIDEFLASRGYVPVGSGSSRTSEKTAAMQTEKPPPLSKPLDFVCEEDVRQAMRQGRKLVIGERTIVTPAARDLAEQHRLFVTADWRQ